MYCHPVKITSKKSMKNMTKEEILNNRKMHTDKRKKIKENALKKYKNLKKLNKLHWSELNI